MGTSETLNRLAARVGIEKVYWDIFGHCHETDEETQRLLLSAMGLPIDTPETEREHMQAMEEQTWLRWLRFVTVVRRGMPMAVPLYLPEEMTLRPMGWSLSTEDGRVRSGKLLPGTLEITETCTVSGQKIVRLLMTLPEDVCDGYHTLTLQDRTKSVRGMIVVAPSASYLPDWFNHERRWGVSCHLYALRSENDWGIGDFTTLRQLATELAESGATCIGLNPLHALFPSNPLHCSPYSPSSRLFLNPLYIDVSAVPEFEACDRAYERIRTAPFQKRLEQARATTYVDYPAVAALKFEVLELLHACFESQHPAGHTSDERRRAFQLFCAEGGESLYRFALYQALVDAHHGLGWPDWPVQFQSPRSAAVLSFAQDKAHARRIEYHLYLQWEADRQLYAAARRCTDRGLSVGLYRDLAVGVDSAGADVWSHRETFAAARVGAPPDQFNAQGQDWGSPPLNPLRLQEENGYADFIAVLRANMRHAGALRIDHVMALLHLFWIPLGGNPSTGAYVSYPLEDLLGIIALESHRHKCMVIGEDLGTVPPAFRDRMTAEGILSYRVLMFEKWENSNLFKRPNTYPPLSLSIASTHDLPTISGYWYGTDIVLKQQLNLVSADQPASGLVEQRNTERKLLHAALVDQQLIAQSFPLDQTLDKEHLQTLVLAVHRFLARSASRFMLVNLDDLFLETTQLNFPGTIDEYPNWRRKLLPLVETLNESAYIHKSATEIHLERSKNVAISTQK